MSLPDPHFLVNFKVYPGTAGEAGLALARTAERIAGETGAPIAVAPQTPDVRLVAEATDRPVVAQAVDPVDPGRGNGAILPEAVTRAGADGVFVNHPERRETLDGVRTILDRCRDLGLDTVVAVDDLALGRAVAALSPDWLLFEAPEDVASGEPMVRTDPDLVEEFVAAVAAVDPEVRVFVGGGIATPDDVAAAFELGADATGAAAAFVGADDPAGWLRSVAERVPDDR